jgi:hypothetical protein
MSEPKEHTEAPQDQQVPNAPEGELSEEDLEQAAGGSIWDPKLPEPKDPFEPLNPPPPVTW